MRSLIITLSLVTIMTTALLGCGSQGGFSSAVSPTNNPSTATPPTPTPTPPPNNGLGDVDLNGYIYQGSATDPVNPVIGFDAVKKEFTLKVPLQFTGVFIEGSGSFPGHADITYSTVFDQNRGYFFLVRLPMKYVLRKVDTAAPGRLPNGDALPAVPSGELPQLSLILNANRKEKVYLYLSKEYFAVLFESKINPGIKLSAEIRDKSKLHVIGFFHLIPAKKVGAVEYPGAFMVTAQFPQQVITFLDRYVEE